MRTFLISDTHLNHANIATYCDRPKNFTDLIIKRWNERVTWADTVIHLGDVAIGPRTLVEDQIRRLSGKKILIRGNHDRSGSNSWWMDHGFDFSCDAMMFGGHWLTHEPAERLPFESQGTKGSTTLNIHGHLHNIWHGFVPNVGEYEVATENKKLNHSWQRLFAIEYTNYYPIEFQEFVDHCDKYQVRWPKQVSS
jgi:calcineurin-like phosphoesterase family protein